MFLFMAWGKSSDKSAAIYQKSLMKRAEVVNIGLKQKNDNAKEAKEQAKAEKDAKKEKESPRKKKGDESPSRKKKGDESPRRAKVGDASPSRRRKINDGKLNDDLSIKKNRADSSTDGSDYASSINDDSSPPKSTNRSGASVTSRSISSSRLGSSTSRSSSPLKSNRKPNGARVEAIKINALKENPFFDESEELFKPANTKKGKAGFATSFCHAVKKSHNFFSIFMRYDAKLTRPRRFLIYFLRVLGLMTVTSIFYQQIKVRTVLHIYLFKIFDMIISV